MAARAKDRNRFAAPVPLASVFVLLAAVALLVVLGSTACGRVSRPATPAQDAASINVATTASASVPVATSATDQDVPRAELLRATTSFLQHLDLSPYLARSAPARSDHFFSGGHYFHASGGTNVMLAFRRERPFVVRDVMLSQTVNL